MSNTLPTLGTSSLTFDDEFNTFVSSPDGSQGWMTTYPYTGEAARSLYTNSEAEYYSDPSVGTNPFSDSNGVLTISATPAAPGSNPYNLPYDSGLITTYTSFHQLYGYFEIRAELPAGTGLWPAFWMLPASNQYTSELDIFEVRGQDPTTIYPSSQGTTNGAWTTDQQALSVANTSTGFHTYGVDWEPNTITFYMDGQEIAQAPTPASMDTPMYMLLDLAVGGNGSWSGPPDSSTVFPAQMKIDYVRAYATAATQDVGGSDAITNFVPLGTLSSNTSPINIGSGSDQLVLEISEDSWEGDAQYTISVDGVQVGGTLTATALHAAGQDQTVTVLGNWGGGLHAVGVDFLNDAYGGTPSMDRNLYVDGASYDGVTDTPDTLSLFTPGTQTLTVGTDPPEPSAVTLGSGPDQLVLEISEDAWEGDAQYTISVDGVQVGGTLTATALHAAGQDQTVTVLGNWGGGLHAASVDFLNDAYGGTPSTDRNLYVDGASYDGVTDTPDTLALYSSGTQTLTVGTAPNPSPLTLGSGPDELVLEISEDAWEGDAQYTIVVDGVQVGGTLTATALHAAGQDQTVTVLGNWGGGLHAVGVDFLNDAYGGTPSTDRNLYVDGASYDGVTDTPDTLALYSSGTQTLTVGTDPPQPSPVTLGSGPDQLVLEISEDAWEGNAQYTISVDGVQVGGTLTATALHAAGQDQTVTVSGNWGGGPHAVSVDFLNDAYGGTPNTDRNLYVDGASYDGVTDTPDTLTLLSSGTQTLTVGGGTGGVPAYSHIVLVAEENQDYGQIIGDTTDAPYINSLAANGALLTNYDAITHPSEPNYFALYAGSTFGVTDDNYHAVPDPTLATVLKNSSPSLSFIGYEEGLNDGSFDPNHTPWYYSPEGNSVAQDFSTSPFAAGNYSSLPSVSFVIPNVNDDMHDGTIAQGDTWLKDNIDSYAQWAKANNSLLVVTWDENDGTSDGNHVATILYGAHVTPGSYGAAYNHYDTLSTMLDSFGLSGPNNAATAAPFSGMWG